MKQRIDGTVTYYDAKTTDVIFSLPIPVSTGYQNVVSNGGEITNKGLEVSLNARAIETPTLRWEIGVHMGEEQEQARRAHGR